MNKVFIIAEIGINHNGSIETAKKMIDAALYAGVDAVKFQTFNVNKLVSRCAPKAGYQKKEGDPEEGQLDMLAKVCLSPDDHKEIFDYCRKKDILFLSAPFDLESVELLDQLGLESLKIPSGEINNLPYLRKIGNLSKKVILSTGMSDLDEIRVAMDILEKAGTPKEKITVLHCNTEYPTPVEDVNLNAMRTIQDELGVEVGYSDHTSGIEIPIAAVTLGASVIEKHFTLDRQMRGPDHVASLEPDELKEMVQSIRNVEKALGNGVKKISPSESNNKSFVRKSIVAIKDIPKGDNFSEENISTKRPGTGISPMEWDNVVGKVAKKNFKEDELIEL